VGIHLRRVLTSLLVVVLSAMPVLATCVVCCDPDVAHGAHASAAPDHSTHASHGAEPPPPAPQGGHDGGAHCTQTADPAVSDRTPSKAPQTAPRIATPERACPGPAVAVATVRAAGRSDAQDIAPSLAAPVKVTWRAACSRPHLAPAHR
jgi:hypothetical protein